LLFAGVLALQLSDGLAADSAAAVPAPDATAATAQPKPTPQLPDNDALMQQILARPLFTADRTAAKRRGQATAAANATFKRRLAGIAIGPDSRTVIFAGDGREKAAAVRVGETIEGWTVTSIGPNSVNLEAAGASQTLELPAAKATSELSAADVESAVQGIAVGKRFSSRNR
jgi:hypothetical protein